MSDNLMSFLKKHWGNIAAVGGTALAYSVHFLAPSLNIFIAQHKNTLWGVVLAAFLAFYNSTAPKDKADK